MTLKKRSGGKLLLFATLGFGYVVSDIYSSTRSVITGLRIEKDLKRVTISTGFAKCVDRSFKIEDLQVASEEKSKTIIKGTASTGEAVWMELPSQESMAASSIKCAEPGLVRAILSGRQAEVSSYRFSHVQQPSLAGV